MTRRESSFIYFKPQPDFPNEDMTEHNAALTTHYLETAPEAEAYTEANERNLRVMHEIGNAALIGAEVEPRNNKAEYQAFCHGFTTLDYMATLLGSRQFRQIQSGESMNHFYLQHKEMADFELWQRRGPWLQAHQNTVDVLRTVSDKHCESPRQFAARAMGAQVASELLYTT